MGRKKRVTAKDVAQLAGVSRTTVSLVLNNAPNVHISPETRRRVLEAARQLNYHPHAAARSLVSQRSMTLGLVLCQSPEQVFADPFLPQVLQGINYVAQAAGYRILLETMTNPEDDGYAALALENRIDGFILSGPRSDDSALRALYEDRFPIVLLGRLPDVSIPFVDVDNVHAAYGAVSHLIHLGHTRIGMITNGPLHYTASADRLEGYRRALADHGLEYDDALVVFGAFREESGQVAMDRLLALDDPPTAVFAASDAIALGALVSLRRQGLRVPDDVALVGFDDIPLAAYVNPPLTTVRLPARQLGEEAARLLIALVEGRPVETTEILLETTLIVRESCGSRRDLSKR